MKKIKLSQFRVFRRNTIKYILVVRGVLSGLVLLILLGGGAISILEEIPIDDAIYFAFVTGLTIGYGDISPETAGGRVVAILIGITGMIFTGLVVAIAARALSSSIKELEEQDRN